MRLDSARPPDSMIYSHCILVTLFLAGTGNAINSGSRLRLLQDFILHQERPASVVSFIPSTDYEKRNMYRQMGAINIAAGYLNEIDTVHASRKTCVIFLLDLNQRNSVEVLLKTQQFKLLDAPLRWIIFVNAQDNNVSTNAIVEETLKKVYLAINTEVYIAFEVDNYNFHLFLAHRKRPNLALEWEFYAKWDNGFDRPKPAEVISMRRRNMAKLKVTAITVMTDPRSVQHAKDFLFRGVDAISKLTFYMMMHQFEWLNATGQVNVTSLWGYQRPDGTFDGAVREMAEERSDFSGSIFFIMKERLPIMEFVVAPTRAELLFVFKKPSLASITNIYALPFSKNVWLSVAGLIIVSTLAFTMAAMREIFVNFSDADMGLGQKVSESFIVTLALVFQQGTEIVPAFMSSRQIMILGLLSFMFLYTAYSANVVALLQSTTNEIDSIEALLASPMQCGSHDMVYNHHLFKHETRPVHRELWLKKGLPQGDRFFMSTVEGIRRVREGMYAFHIEQVAAYDEIQRTFQENEKCHIGTMKYTNFPYPHFAISRKSLIKEQLRIGAVRMKENGVQSRSNRRIIATHPQCDSSAAVFTAVGVVDVAPAFTTLLVVYGCAVIVLGLEVLAHRRLGRIKKETRVENQDINTTATIRNRIYFTQKRP